MNKLDFKILHNGAILSKDIYIDPSFKLNKAYSELSNWLINHPNAESLKYKGSLISYFFWNYFYPKEMYEKFLPSFPEEFIHNLKDGLLNQYLNITKTINRKKIEKFKALILSVLIFLHNKKILFINKKASLLLIRYSTDDFRTKYLYDYFIKSKIDFIQAIPLPSRKYLLKNLFSLKPEFIYFLWNKSPFTPFYFSIDPVNIAYANHVADIDFGVSFHTSILKGSNIKTVYGIDDVNFIFPFLRACRLLNIKTFGHQHGASYIPYHAGYFLQDLAEENHVWFDNLILWNDYWLKKARSCSSYFNKVNLISGYNKHPVKYLSKLSIPKIVSKTNLNILIPYEFLASSFQISKFIKCFIDQGNNVFLKLRNDDPYEAQLETYNLGKGYESKIKIIETINDEIMSRIDIVAGTQSAMIYDLIVYEKPIWLLDIDFVFFDFMYEEGMASRVVLTGTGFDVLEKNPKEKYIWNDHISKYKSLDDFLDWFSSMYICKN